MWVFVSKRHFFQVLLVSSVIGAAIFFWSIYPVLLQLQEQKNKEHEIQDQIMKMSMQRDTQKDIKLSVTQSDYLNGIIHAARENQLIIQTLDLLKSEQMGDVNRQWVRWIAEGSFPSIMHFLQSMNQMTFLFILRDFDLHMESSEVLRLTAKGVIYLESYPGSRHALFTRQVSNNPFILPHKIPVFVLTDPSYSPPSRWDKIPIYQMQFAGSTMQKGVLVGLVKLPAGEIRMVAPGAIIGIERALVLKVSENGLILNIKGKMIDL